ncbi:MAG: UDP-N-acetylmuramate dehydrogenase [Patescibacteria group bacterium]
MMVLRLKTDVELAPLTTFGIGGRAAFFIQAKNPDELIAAVELATEKHWPYFLLAGGSNVVFDDRTFRGLVIHFIPKVSPGQWQGLTLTMAANLPLAVLIKTAINHKLAGLEMLSGIPGTVGGAIVGNAGAYGQSISDHLVRVEIFSSDKNKRQWLTKKQCQFAYRESIFKQGKLARRGGGRLILRAEFCLTEGDEKMLAQKSREIIKIRSKKYSPKLRCPGSFFKNVLADKLSPKILKLIPPEKIIEGKIPAGYLLEQVGAKGMRQGSISVADFHGNLLINDGRGTYREVITLATKLKKLVKDKFGIILDEEIRYAMN